MNKKIEDAANEYFKSKILYATDTEQYLSFFKAGAEWALREAIKILKEQNEDAQYFLKRHYASDYSQGIYDQTVILKKLIEQLLSSEDKNAQP